MLDGLYGKIPESIINQPESLGAYAAYMQHEENLTTFSPIERLDSPGEMLQAIKVPQLTEAVRERILMGLQRGCYPEDAAAQAGIPAKIWREWMGHAAKQLEPFYEFYLLCMAAEADATGKLIDVLKDDVAGAKFLLERRHSRPSLAEQPAAVTPRFRKQTNQELLLEAAGGDAKKAVSVMKPKERAVMLESIQAAILAQDLAEMEAEKALGEIFEDEEETFTGDED